jgi:hypothetical protein
MNRLIVTLVAIASLGLAATAARAERKVCEGSGTTCEHDIKFEGTIKPSCECDAANGSLPTKALATSLSSLEAGGSAGSFTARCNTTGAKVTYSMTYTPPGSQASVAKYSVVGPISGNGDDVDPPQIGPATRSWPNFTSQTALISARVDAPGSEALLAGTYKVVVKATVTP